MPDREEAGKKQDRGQSQLTFIDKLKRKSCLKAKKNITSMASEGFIPIPLPPPPPPPPASAVTAAIPSTAQQPNLDQGAGQNHANHNAASANPQNTHQSGQVTYQRPVDITIGPESHGLPGYIRIQGGTHNYAFNNYDAHIPLAELIEAGPEQRSAILSTLSMGRVGNAYGHEHGNVHAQTRGRLSNGQFVPDGSHPNIVHHIPVQNQRAVTMASTPHRQPQLTFPAPAPNPKSAGKAASHHSKNKTYRSDLTEHCDSHSNNGNNNTSGFPVKTPILDRYLKTLTLAPPTPHQPYGFVHSMAIPASPAMSPANDVDTELSCYICHATKDPCSRNVKRLADLGNMCLCFRCLHAQIGGDAGIH